MFTEIHNRFDGIVVGIPDESKYYRFFIGTFKSDKYEEDLNQDIIFALKYFFPKWKGFILGKNLPNLSCKEALDCVDMILRGFWSNYGERFKMWRQDYIRCKRHVGMVRKDSKEYYYNTVCNVMGGIYWNHHACLFMDLSMLKTGEVMCDILYM